MQNPERQHSVEKNISLLIYSDIMSENVNTERQDVQMYGSQE